jgi:hypothetical protein
MGKSGGLKALMLNNGKATLLAARRKIKDVEQGDQFD